ncbi:MAG: right-handed parallel beta-helix repeat-containing protein [Solirubrobacterales bacterium]|nr:right-handed parallel beta-helix repeat-containing protein [Solirubrobacterales bacterium]
MARARGNRWKAALGATAIGLVVPGAALAHLERPSYWPDPAPDASITPAAGGGVPAARSLSSAVTKRRSARGSGRVRVVCDGANRKRSFQLAKASIRQARTQGFRVRPSQPEVRYSAKKARQMLSINRRLHGRCRFNSVQKAVDASGNNDRIVIMPGRYLEPESRRQPKNDPRCSPGLLQKDASGDPTPSYEYQVTCPHDQNLVYVAGRAVVGKPLAEPRADRQGIPEQELGPCVRCNLQIEGSGPKAEDVIIDAGDKYEGEGPEAKPLDHAKDVVMRVDRGDGFVGRNFLMRGAREHGFYTEETDGVLLDRTKFFWNADYGHLAFTSDHQLVKNCDGMGAGDAVIYPGGTPETGSQATGFYPDAPRKNTVITKCDMRNSALGYSGSMGNAVRITDNHIYGNTTGIASDTLSSAGHPGFPADSAEVDHNFIYANNFNTYDKASPVKPLVTVPIGTGIVYAGMNDARIHDNWFFDNWRFATMLFAVPDALTNFGGPEGAVFPGVSCAGAPEIPLSTSCGNHQFDNRMGKAPPGFEYPEPLERYGVPHGEADRSTLPNGTDFWWDEFLSNRANCWYDNVGPGGTPASITGPGDAGRAPGLPPNLLPDCGGGENEGLSIGNGDVAKEQYLINCSEGPSAATGPLDCDWYTPPARPGSASAAARSREVAVASQQFARSAEGRRLRQRMEALVAGAGG